MDDMVRALFMDPAGNLYAGGRFRSTDGVLLNGVAKWVGSQWNSPGTGMGDWGEAQVTAICRSGIFICAVNATS